MPPVTDIEATATGAKRGSGGAQKELVINRVSSRLNAFLVKFFSNLRLSLTLRISLHYAGQLIKSTLVVLAVALVALSLAQIPTISGTMDALADMKPLTGQSYTTEQLAPLYAKSARISDEIISDDLKGFFRKAELMFSELDESAGKSGLLLVYRNTVQGGLIAGFSVKRFSFTATVLCCTLLCLDLFRVLLFLKHRNKLNKRVLKPISDMAATAQALSANNLSDRISVDGTKNELKDLAAVINGMLDRIELSYNSQKQFVSDASHELRTPIAVIQGYVGMLERWGKTDKEVLDEGLQAISQETASMKELVDRLLFLARHDKKTLMLEMESFDPLEVMSEVHREARLLSSAHRFELTPAQNALINADKGMIKQLMRILVDNAIKYTPEGGSITLGARREGLNCVLSVSDTGEGIAAEELPKVFERFYRCDEARRSQTSGHGLGLSIARIIVAAHSGKLKVRSKPGAGTTFSVWLPIVIGKE